MMKYDKMSEKFKELYINGSLQISALLDMIKLKGLNNFLKKKTKRQSNIYVRCKYRTAVKKFTRVSLKTINFLENDGTATHIVTKIQYGLTPLLISLNISRKQSI